MFYLFVYFCESSSVFQCAVPETWSEEAESCQGNRPCIMRRPLRHSCSPDAVGSTVYVILNTDAYVKGIFAFILHLWLMRDDRPII